MSSGKRSVVSPDANARFEYPRPQLERREWLCLNGKWDYVGGKQIASALNPARPIDFGKTAEKILVPYCPESVLSGVERKQEINMWYRRTFEIPSAWEGKQVIINFDAVDHDATIFVNGEKAGSHSGGYSSFQFNITRFLKTGFNTVVVAAHDPNDGKTPSGKNGPRGDYTFTSGIWQSVWLEPVSEQHIENIRILPDLANSRLELIVNASTASSSLKITALDGGKIVAEKSGSSSKQIFLPIKEPRLWSPDSPFLYDLTIQLLDKKGAVLDDVKSYFGMREVKMEKVNGVVRPLL
ncbi:MAG: glycoside hydrolase family 2, partial [Pedobacter sp.]